VNGSAVRDEVYEYAVDPANVPEWAPGLGSAVENVEGQWFVDTSMGRVGLAFVERNFVGVLDHEVTLPSGEVIYLARLKGIVEGRPPR
jgi:hypothetical protein